MIVTLKNILKEAEKGKYAVGLFNVLNLEMARAIIEAAEEEKSPVILSVAEVHFPSIPFDYASKIMYKIASEATVPVCLHLDHGTDYAKIIEAIKAGFSSVMYDGSALPYEENIANTAAVSKVAHAVGCSVEAELGHVGSAASDDGHDAAMYTEVDQVNDFIDRSGCDALAIAVGTAHGQYKSTPKLDFGRLSEIYAISKCPLVIHGGSGLSDDDFKELVRRGIRKVNICTEMCLVAHKSYHESYEAGLPFEAAVILAKDAVKGVVKNKMQLFSSSGKA